MGVFGMLAAALWVFALREVSSDENWKRIGKFVSVSFWGLNIGLAGMLLITLFPSGIIQLADVVTNGYWHARSIAFTGSKSMNMFGWIRLPADFVFIVFGILPLCTATFLTMIYSHKDASMKRKLTA
jgi:nitric oxide reductase subunit B